MSVDIDYIALSGHHLSCSVDIMSVLYKTQLTLTDNDIISQLTLTDNDIISQLTLTDNDIVMSWCVLYLLQSISDYEAVL